MKLKSNFVLRLKAQEMFGKIQRGKPPNYKKIKAALPGISGEEIFCYGNYIYNTTPQAMTQPLLVHEAVHSFQQGDDIEGWWDRYLEDPDFRFIQELDAHRAEYQEARRLTKDREIRRQYLDELARRLSSDMYGKVVSRKEARRLIRKKERVR